MHTVIQIVVEAVRKAGMDKKTTTKGFEEIKNPVDLPDVA
jgi:hypothetical protein